MGLTWRQHSGWQWITAAFWAVCVACACTAPAVATARPIDATASLPMVGEWVRAVGGEHVQVRVVAHAGADPHTFEPSVRSIQAVTRGQVLFIIGLGLEPWAERLAANEPTLHIVPIAPTTGLRRIGAGHHHHHHTSAHAGAGHFAETAPITDSHHHAHAGAACPTHAHEPSASVHTASEAHSCNDHHHAPAHLHDADCEHHADSATDGHGAVSESHAGAASVAHEEHCTHGEFDPHVWLDPVLVKDMVRTIAQTLSRLAPQHADIFHRNAQAYCAQLDALDAEIHTLFAQIDSARRKLVTNHDNLHYFARRYGFVVMDTLFGSQGMAGGQPSARRVNEIVANIRAHEIEALFADASSSRNLLEAVALEADLPPPGSFYSIPSGPDSSAPDYLQMMRHNANEITRILTVADNR